MCAFFVRTTEGESREPELKPKPKPELKLPLCPLSCPAGPTKAMSRKGQQIMNNQKITPETSYKTLKSMVPDASTVHTPKGEALIRSDSEILVKVKEDGGMVIVYKNGFFAYIDDQGEPTARAVANCHVMKFGKAEGGYEPVDESIFEDMPFPYVLSHFGMMNIEDVRPDRALCSVA